MKIPGYCLFALLLTACAHQPPPPVQPAPPPVPHGPEAPMNDLAQLMLAEMAGIRQDWEQALALTYPLAMLDPDPGLQQRALWLAVKLRDGDKLAALSQRPGNLSDEPLPDWPLLAAIWQGRQDKSSQRLQAWLAFDDETFLTGLGWLLEFNEPTDLVPIWQALAETSPQAARPWFALSLLLDQQGQLTDSLAAMAQARQRAPEDSFLRNAQFELLARYGQLPELDQLLRLELARSPQDEDLRLQAATLWQRYRKPQWAEPLLLDLLQRHPEQADWRLQLADLYWSQRRCDELLPWLKSRPESLNKRQRSGWHFYRGQCAWQAGDPLRAQAELIQVQKGLYWPEAQLSLLQIQAQGKSFDPVADKLSHLLTEAPSRAGLWLEQGYRLYQQQAPDRLANWLDSLQERLGIQLAWQQWQVQLRLDRGETTQVVAWLEQQAQQRPQLAEDLWLAAVSWFLDTSAAQALLPAYQSAMAKAATGKERWHYGLAILQVQAGQVAAAEATLQQILHKTPEHASALNALGYLWVEQNRNLKQAGQLLQRALGGAPGDPAIIDSLGWLQYRLGQFEAAAQTLETAWRLSGEPEILLHLLELAQQRGQTGKVAEWLAIGQREFPDDPRLDPYRPSVQTLP